MKAGSKYLGKGSCTFNVWAPLAKEVSLHLLEPYEKIIPLEKHEMGYHSITVSEVSANATYKYRLNDQEEYPDPASHYQIKDVHGPSVVVDHTAFEWDDEVWKGVSINEMIIYELHIGTFTREGTFEAAVSKLDHLVDLGINAIEIMPVSQFSGNRNWGYDGVYLYSVHNTYGTPDQFKRLINECHKRNIAVILDVVYNHLGPEGNYLSNFGPYFTDTYRTPWGDAINFDGEYADGVRDFFADNALHWFENYHIDGLRLDATHMVFDNSAVHFWEYLSMKVKDYSSEKGRRHYLIAENDTNGLKHLKPLEQGGYGFDAAWLDDFHHAEYVLLDKKGKDYYADFGDLSQLIKAIREGYVHSGEYVEFRKRKHGISSKGVLGNKFVVFSQNHDQIGNRMSGERNSVLMDFEALKLSAAIVLLSPYIPMLFMGEEYGEDNPFLYFISHLDEELVKLVQEGRMKDFEGFNFEGTPPDPQAEETFNKCKLDWEKKRSGKYLTLFAWYKEIIQVRKNYSSFKNFDKKDLEVTNPKDKLICMKRKGTLDEAICLFNLSDCPIEFDESNYRVWKKVADSDGREWNEDLLKENMIRSNVLPPWNVKVFIKE